MHHSWNYFDVLNGREDAVMHSKCMFSEQFFYLKHLSLMKNEKWKSFASLAKIKEEIAAYKSENYKKVSISTPL